MVHQSAAVSALKNGFEIDTDVRHTQYSKFEFSENIIDCVKSW